MKTRIFKLLSLTLLLSLICLENKTYAQTMMPLPPHSSVYSSMVRGYWFSAPANFTITGLKVASNAGSGLQYIHVMKCTGTFPIAFGSPSTSFITLAYLSGGTNNTILPVNISVQQGDQIGILGTAGQSNSYSASSTHTTTLAGQTISICRMGYQGDIDLGPAPNYWGVDATTNGSIGRVFMYYITALPTDAGLSTYIYPTDTVCAGTDSVLVKLKNYGPTNLVSVDVDWKVNTVSQTTYNWNGTLIVGDSTDINIGTYNFLSGVNYDLVTYTSNPNNAPDTMPANDTINMTINDVIEVPLSGISPAGPINICQNDSAVLTTTSTAGLIYEWFRNNVTIAGETDSTFSATIAGTYYVIVTNSSGCSSTSNSVVVTVTQLPIATATAQGATTFCKGDSVLITSSVIAGLTYQWQIDGVDIPGATGTYYYAKKSGAHTVTTVNAANCSKTSTPVNVTANPELDLGPDQVICENHQITLDAGAGMTTYLWSTGETTQTIQVDSTGIGTGNSKDISVRVTKQACIGNDTITITFVNCNGIAENAESLGIEIFPNPSKGIVNIDIPGRFDRLEITVVNSIGETVLREYITTQSKTVKIIDLSASPKGLYFIVLKSDNRQQHRKVILK